MNDEIEKRLLTLETALAHLENQFDDLNQVVIKQTRQIYKLESLLHDNLNDQDRELLEEIKSRVKKPPHSSG